MTDTITVAVVSFIFGAIFVEFARVYVRRPKGYVRLKHHGISEPDTSGRRTVHGREGTSAIRSKFDYLFNYKSDKEAPKIDLADVERSFRPDSRPETTSTSGGLQNRYLDLSHLAADKPAEEPVSSQQQPQYPTYSQNIQSTASPQVTPPTGYTPPVSPLSQVQKPAGIFPAGEQKAAKDEKEHEWKPMGFFDD